jgi:RNA polymerase-binding transcription factor DksA
MPDFIDRSVERQLEYADSLHAAAQLPELPYGPPTCANCGDDLPTRRRELGLQTCVSCAQARERSAALYRRR